MSGTLEAKSPAARQRWPGQSGTLGESTPFPPEPGSDWRPGDPGCNAWAEAAGWREIFCPFDASAKGYGPHYCRYRASAGESGTLSCAVCDLFVTGSEVAELIGQSVEAFLAESPGLLEIDRRTLEQVTARAERTLAREASNAELAELVYLWAAQRWPLESAPALRSAVVRGAERGIRARKVAA